ncbi:serine protease FAM111A-like [Cyprinus carpio]|uniref:Serine protease FAM111A-like n=1 Tax=Cyprinus carpio TaxID=7962 RepID=A0A9Q9W9N4_CYPCA|nr:serine protease FAM111A-like [Cyprinus carpio]
MVPKPDGTLRFCNDFRRLNEVSEFDGYPMPRVDELLDRLGRARYISTLDLTKGYWQRMMDILLRPHQAYAAAYLDDVVVHSEAWDEHLDRLRRVHSELRRAGLTANPRKCHLALSEAKYLGYQVGRGLIRPQDKKVEAIHAAPRPETKTQVLRAPDFSCPFLLQTDASDTGLGAVFSQIQEGEEHPIIYISRKLSPAERKYAAVEKEALAIRWAVLELRYYLLGRKFTLYAFRGEKIKTALRRDGRFNNVIFRKHCALSEFSDELKHEWSNLVDNLDGKSFQVVVLSNKNQPDSQDDLTPVKTKPNVASGADVAETAGSSQNPISTEQEKKHDGNTKSTNPSTKRYAVKPIADSEEILGILREQFPVLLKQLKQREKLKTKSDVQKFFRAEYGKSVENFLKVKKVKQLMKLSDSVCQIRQEGSALGTGFLLFDRYVLTNAHVFGESTDVPQVNAAQFTAVFGYEDLDSEDSKHIPVEQVTAYFHRNDDKGRYLDYALLELDDVDKIAEYPRLLDCYHPNVPINRGQICIVGHPGEGVKKMDPCFIIERENQQLIHIVKDCSEKKWDFSVYENQIPYDSCFFEGSSGSPVFDVDCNLIGIHTGGYKYEVEDKSWYIMEYGFSMQPILDNIRAQARMKGLPDIVSVIEAYSNVSGTAEQQNQNDIEMKDAEESDEL